VPVQQVGKFKILALVMQMTMDTTGWQGMVGTTLQLENNFGAHGS
jgi:hypothetical protein